MQLLLKILCFILFFGFVKAGKLNLCTRMLVYNWKKKLSENHVEEFIVVTKGCIFLL